ncbi:MAG: hypothetical protein HC906_18060, partial [Bacteroidales bacterium]|nr:hypothetical protein [Bacteroidales bacterium]
IPRNQHLLENLPESIKITRLTQFTKGYYTVREVNGEIHLYDLRFGRMGIDEDAPYIFSFKIEENENGVTVSEAEPQAASGEDMFSQYMDRIFGKE